MNYDALKVGPLAIACFAAGIAGITCAEISMSKLGACLSS